MTEADWYAFGDPLPLHDFAPPRANERKLRLFAVANCRAMVPPPTDHSTAAMLDAAEVFAEGLSSPATLARAVGQFRLPNPPENWIRRKAWRQLAPGLILNLTDRNTFVWLSVAPDFKGLSLRQVVAVWAEYGYPFVPAPAQAELYRCLFGTPFRQVRFDPRWQTETALALANGMYLQPAFDRAPILADALEEAGCDHPDVLNHLRGPGPHARGCWVVDGVLGKS